MFKKLCITLVALLIFSISAIAGERTERIKYKSSGPLKMQITEVRDTRGTLGYKSYDDWRYKSVNGRRYKISVDYNGSSFQNCKIESGHTKATARAQGDWSWTSIRVVAIDRMSVWNYNLRIRYTNQ